MQFILAQSLITRKQWDMYQSYHLIVYLFLSVPLIYFAPLYFIKRQKLHKQMVLNKIRRIKFIEQKLSLDNQRIIRLEEIDRINKGYYSK